MGKGSESAVELGTAKRLQKLAVFFNGLLPGWEYKIDLSACVGLYD